VAGGTPGPVLSAPYAVYHADKTEQRQGDNSAARLPAPPHHQVPNAAFKPGGAATLQAGVKEAVGGL